MKLVAEIVADLEEKQKQYDKTHNTEELKQCIFGFIELLNAEPENPQILSQLATAFLQGGSFGIAAQLYRRAIAYWPANPKLWSNMGVCYRSLHMIPEARSAFIKAIMLEDKAEIHNNMAATYINEADPEGGMVYANKATQLDPEHPKPKWNCALLMLEQEKWEQGFTYFESGLFTGERPMRFYTGDEKNDLPWWDGTEGKTIALWDEQGLGDRLMSYGLLRRLEGRARVILECHDRLESIVRRSFPWIDFVYPTSKDEKISWPTKHKIDYKLPVFSLAKMYWSRGEFDRAPYIKPLPELVEKYREELKKLGPPPHIAFSWAGGTEKTNTKHRSLKLNQFKPLIESGGTWVSLQYHKWAKEKVSRFREETKLPVHHLDAAQAHDYDHTLAALAACDLTISACNTVIHTCGAAGTKCWVLVPRKRAWRYPSSTTFPWYGDHIVQYHQKTDGDWDELMGRVKADLVAWLPKEAA